MNAKQEDVAPKEAPTVGSVACADASPAAPGSATPVWVEVAGWLGTAAIVGAYAGLSFGWLQEGAIHQAVNFVGACGVGVLCFWKRTWQPFWLQVVWGGVAAIALIRLL